tara:strand:+ start:1921 stop:2124 length:204 start_codon:yes stop_codon:yes gene_type:complete
LPCLDWLINLKAINPRIETTTRIIKIGLKRIDLKVRIKKVESEDKSENSMTRISSLSPRFESITPRC